MQLTRRQVAMAIGLGAIWGLLSALLSFPPPTQSPAGYRWMPTPLLLPAWVVCLLARCLPCPAMGVFLTRSGLQLEGCFYTGVYIFWSVAVGAAIALAAIRIIVPLVSRLNGREKRADSS